MYSLAVRAAANESAIYSVLIELRRRLVDVM
jgi:hypothetical protein